MFDWPTCCCKQTEAHGREMCKTRTLVKHNMPLIPLIKHDLVYVSQLDIECMRKIRMARAMQHSDVMQEWMDHREEYIFESLKLSFFCKSMPSTINKVLSLICILLSFLLHLNILITWPHTMCSHVHHSMSNGSKLMLN